jgi:hypothetical protein
VQDVLEGLMGLPALRELSMDIGSEEEVDLLLQALPKLSMLNGRRVSGETEDPRASNMSNPNLTRQSDVGQ